MVARLLIKLIKNISPKSFLHTWHWRSIELIVPHKAKGEAPARPPDIIRSERMHIHALPRRVLICMPIRHRTRYIVHFRFFAIKPLASNHRTISMEREITRSHTNDHLGQFKRTLQCLLCCPNCTLGFGHWFTVICMH